MRQICVFAMVLIFLVVVAATTAAFGQSFSVLYNFGAHPGDPLRPQASGVIAQGRDGNFYSTTPKGGSSQICHHCGTVFMITPTGHLTVLYSFDGFHGGSATAGLTLAKDGNFYGATEGGGTLLTGTAFRITPQGGQPTVLFNFTAGKYGADPQAPPIQGKDGNFYGTTEYGGKSLTGGTVYKLTPAGKITILHQFSYPDETSAPVAPLLQATDGDFYGTTSGRGTSAPFGEVFKITPQGKLTPVYIFKGSDGAFASAPVIQGSDGNFYGTTVFGGASNKGVVFKLSAGGKLTVLHQFKGSDGAHPYAGLVQAADGNFYGVASKGGSNNVGTIYRITADGTFTLLHNFDGAHGANPSVTLLQSTNGLLYGDTRAGGKFGSGIFYSLKIR